jgi:deoxyribodipyrimidine photo-lyase
MIAARRARWNFALDRAIAWAKTLGKPLLVLEALRIGYPWASDRLRRFILAGMADNAQAFDAQPALYFPYVERAEGEGKGLLQALAQSACVVVTDEFPSFFLPRMVSAAAQRLEVALEVVDGNGLLPLSAADRGYTSAFDFRRFLQRELPRHASESPRPDPFAGVDLPHLDAPPGDVEKRWERASPALLAGSAEALAALPIDHSVPPVAMQGGSRAAERALHCFVADRLARYADQRSDPDADATSRLSPYLHFGHVAAHQVFAAIAERERWSGEFRRRDDSGSREGWWGMSAAAEAFLDEFVTWRELAYDTCAHRPTDYDRYESLPNWALETLDRHRSDTRPHLYTHAEFEAAATHDPLWNAAQRQLLREGWFHNRMRMLWAKKILEWSCSPEEALATMTAIMDRWSLDGRNPNSYAGYMWTLGRYDRPWPERAVYGKVRAMSSESTRRKAAVEEYLRRYSR